MKKIKSFNKVLNLWCVSKITPALFLASIMSLPAQAEITCPFGYVLVPGNSELGTVDFCVMKYEAKAHKDRNANALVDLDEIRTNGCDRSGSSCEGGSHNWGLADHKPVSVPQGIPWRKISRDKAAHECQSLGEDYYLISNVEWQTVARNIELVSENWSENQVGKGCLNQGNVSVDSDCSYNGRGPEPGARIAATHLLSNGETISDFSGNVWEWVSDDNNQKQGGNAYIASQPSVKSKYGPSGNYSCNSQNRYCGLGYGYTDYSAGAVRRGGSWVNLDFAGVFAVGLDHVPSYSNHVVGFRCVFRPESHLAPLPADYTE